MNCLANFESTYPNGATLASAWRRRYSAVAMTALLTSYRLGILFALITACGLGAITTQAKITYADGGNALTLMLFRFFASSLVFGLILLLRRESPAVGKPLRLPLALVGLVWSAAMICYLTSVESISVSLAVLILYTYPLQVLAFALLMRQIRASPGLIMLFIAAFCGLYLTLAGAQIKTDPVGILFAALASLGAAFTFICGARVAPRMSPLVMSFWVNLAGLVLILPMLPGQIAMPQSAGGGLALALATGFYLIAILSQFQALSRLSAARAALVLNLEPIVSILLAYLVINEVLSLTQWAGVLIVIGAVLISLRFGPEA